MKNLKKLTKKNLKNINGGALGCPPLANWCSEWCAWTAWQQTHCLNAVLDPMPCDC
ncbi:bacteriocin-like protein [Chryseobacterium sp. MIQD13]|uniref:bacteriocin-like protein n=1 Tax=Chryseobacterium sp. MIQD13 TaxID=3422310 RepID=UPI003D27FCF9